MRKLNYFDAYVFFLFFCVSALPCQAQELPQIVKKIAPSTVIILTYDKDGEIIGQGSGFFISSDGNIITNRHVLADANRAEVKTADGKVYPITRIVAENKDADIVRASVGVTPPVSTLSLSSSIPEVGGRIAVIGNPLGLEQTVSDGIVSAVREIPEFGKIYQITAPISPGSSGSPVVNMKGEVIGVATFQFVEGQNLNFAIPSEHISRLKAEKGKSLEEWAMENVEEWLTTAEGLYFSGLIFLWTDDYEKALPYFQNAVEKDPNYADAWFYIGYCNGELGRHTEEIEAYKQAIRIKPDYAEAHYNLGAAYVSLGRYYEASEAYKQAIRLKPDWADAHYCLGLTYWLLEGRDSALQEYRILKDLDEDLANQLFNLIYK